jgi:murein DD-endopeptidase MepM/ murein hydrolase activator NlpD
MAAVIDLPFTGLWRARNSPARRVPSHGTDLLASSYAIDFIGVDSRGRSALSRDWRTFLATEPPSRFVGFDRPLLSPGDGTVVTAHDGEPDHAARRSQLALLAYALSQPARLRRGLPAIAGNYVIIALKAPAPDAAKDSHLDVAEDSHLDVAEDSHLDVAEDSHLDVAEDSAVDMAKDRTVEVAKDSTVYVALVHLRRASLRVTPGDSVHHGTQLATCGNSGNSTQPHLHIQLMTSPDMSTAQAVPMAFTRFQERPPHSSAFTTRLSAVPTENALLKP